MKRAVQLKDSQGNELFPRGATMKECPEGAILAISTSKSSFENIPTTPKLLSIDGTWQQFGVFSRPEKGIMKITVPAGETWVIKFRTLVASLYCAGTSTTSGWACIGTCEIKDESSNSISTYFDSGIGYTNLANSAAEQANQCTISESVQSIGSGDHYFGLWARSQSTASIRGNTKTSQPTRSDNRRGNSLVHIATLVKRIV